LTTEEQAHVRAALRFLRARCGGWAPLAKVLRFKRTTLGRVANGRTVSASVAFRVARLAKVGVDDVLAGRFPPAGACPYCGHCREAASAQDRPTPHP
jgi:hypothetical protein